MLGSPIGTAKLNESKLPKQQEAAGIEKTKSSPKKEAGGNGTLKLSLSGGLSPYSMIGKARPLKSEINFDKEMKKHGIDKDIASVRSSRQILQSSSPQSVSPNIIIPQSKAKESKDRKLEIKTSFKTSDIGIDTEVGQQIAPGSGKSESYMFPFHKRSRSLSPDP